VQPKRGIFSRFGYASDLAVATSKSKNQQIIKSTHRQIVKSKKSTHQQIATSKNQPTT